jgi:NNP family nitrate/nitrite transporter-like MFS transporter
MNIFARTLGGVWGDKAGIKWGLRGRVVFLGIILALEGLALLLFSQMSVLLLAIGTMLVFSLFVQMANGATFSVVPFINRRALGSVAGIVGAGGNAGAMAFGFLFRMESLSTETALFYLGIFVLAASTLVLLVRFSDETEAEERAALDQAMAARAVVGAPSRIPAAGVAAPALRIERADG